MEDHQIVIHGTYQVEFKGLEILVIQVEFASEKAGRHCYFIHYPGASMAIAKFLAGEHIYWSGSDCIKESADLGRAIEAQAGKELPCQPVCNPFLPGSAPLKIDIFHIAGAIIEKAVNTEDETDEIYYRVRTGDDKRYLLVRFKLPLNSHWEWLPCNQMEEDAFRYLVSIITEYENGDFEKQNRLNQVLLKLLKTEDKNE